MNKVTKLMLMPIAALCLMSSTSCGNNTKEAPKTELTISAAASLKEVMADLEKEFIKSNPNISLTFNFGSSGSIQKQIEEGAPSDVFISAGESQMNALDEKGLIDKDSLSTLLKNQLVLITNTDTVNNMDDLSKVNHIAMGEPSSVPAGKYADESLTKLNLKESLTPKLVYGKDVKEVLSWVVFREAEAGFVYKSDTYCVDSIKVVDTISEEYHSPINYPVAVIKDSKNIKAAKEFKDFLSTDRAKELFRKYGYEPY